jgi:hypothetical protein
MPVAAEATNGWEIAAAADINRIIAIDTIPSLSYCQEAE